MCVTFVGNLVVVLLSAGKREETLKASSGSVHYSRTIVHNLRPESSSVFVTNVTEAVNAVPWYEERDGNGFDGGVAPAAKVDAA